MDSFRDAITPYVQSWYFVEVVAVVIFAIGLIFPLRQGLRVQWHELAVWRQAFVVLGWLFFTAALLVWLALLYITVSALLVAVEGYWPKPHALIFVILGGFLYFFLLGCAGASFQTASGSARTDVQRKLGVEPDAP